MANMLQTGMEFLDTVRKSHLSETATMRRGADSVEVSVTLGATSFEVTDEDGITIQSKVQDIIVSAGDLVLSGVTVLPALYDTWEFNRGTELHTFEVLSLGGGKPYEEMHPRYQDGGADLPPVMLRIHTKLKSVASV